MTPGLLGVSHVSLSVEDVAATIAFWHDVLGFRLIESHPTHTLLLDDASRTAVILTDLEGQVRDPFDERRSGLNHLALAVADLESLTAWEQRLAASGVPVTPAVETDAGHHLNVRAPGNIALELTVLKPEFLVALGLAQESDAYAGTHA